jgi:hypothetical protein
VFVCVRWFLLKSLIANMGAYPFACETLAVIRKAVCIGSLALVIWLLISPQTCIVTQAQAATFFSPSDKFSIPTQNSTVSFAVNGSYSSATLENGTWTFKDLKLDIQNASFLGINASDVARTLRISAENSNITVLSYLTVNYTLNVDLLSYNIEGLGTQTINLGLNSTDSSSVEWSVFVANTAFLSEGQGWILQPDSTVVVTGQTGNVTIAHFNFNDETRNLGFFLQHYVALTIALVLVVVVAVATVIKFRAKRKKKTQ